MIATWASRRTKWCVHGMGKVSAGDVYDVYGILTASSILNSSSSLSVDEDSSSHLSRRSRPNCEDEGSDGGGCGFRVAFCFACGSIGVVKACVGMLSGSVHIQQLRCETKKDDDVSLCRESPSDGLVYSEMGNRNRYIQS